MLSATASRAATQNISQPSSPAATPQPDQLSPPSLSDSAQIASLAAIDTAGRTVEAAENAVAATAHVINEAVPATVRTICSVLPIPQVASSTISGLAEGATHAATFVAQTALQAGAQALTFGTPAWSQAVRQGLAVSGVASELSKDDASTEFLARCVAESSEQPLIKDALLAYLEQRKELSDLRASGAEASQPRLSELAQSIATLEVRLRDYQDFRDLKQVLDQGGAFIEKHQRQVNDLALETADRVISNVENYYKSHVGSLAGPVEAAWAALDDRGLREKARTTLRDKIALRLHKVFDSEMSSEQTTTELGKVTHDLHVAFGSYRHAFRGAMGTALGIAAATGGLHAALDYAWKGASWVINTTHSTLSDGVSYVCRWAGESLRNALHSVSDWLYQTVSSAISSNPVVKAMQQGAEAVTALPEKIADAAESIGDSVFGPNVPDYSHPYWTGSSRIMTGVDEHFNPVYGTSCTSGFPATPRIEGITNNITGLSDFFSKPPVTPGPNEGALDVIMRAYQK